MEWWSVPADGMVAAEPVHIIQDALTDVMQLYEDELRRQPTHSELAACLSLALASHAYVDETAAAVVNRTGAAPVRLSARSP
jgi:hypothetical protein